MINYIKLTLLFLCLSSSALIAQTADTTIYTIVEEMPRFSGCEDLSLDIKAKKACADQKLLAYIYNNLKTPKDIDITSLGSMVAISFVIDESGKVVNPTIVRNMHPDVDPLILDLVKNMPPWIPGKQKGKTVKVRQVMPMRICFK